MGVGGAGDVSLKMCLLSVQPGASAGEAEHGQKKGSIWAWGQSRLWWGNTQEMGLV